MCGIFGYLNFNVKRDRKFIIDAMINGLKRLEYRGYDSAGIAIDGNAGEKPTVIKEKGNISVLKSKIDKTKLDLEAELLCHAAIGHTRWATHGVPSENNAHPHVSGSDREFIIVHNGIITNFKPLRTFLAGKGYAFESETDTEIIAKFLHFMYHSMPKGSTFNDVVANVVHHLEGSFALLVKSMHFPNEIVATRRGSPLIIGLFTKDDKYQVRLEEPKTPLMTPRSTHVSDFHHPSLMVNNLGMDGSEVHLRASSAEFFFASDASAIIEHTKKAIILEDGDLAHCAGGELSITAVAANVCGVGNDIIATPQASAKPIPITRDVSVLELELAQIMKSNYDHFMMKEIFEQPETVMNTMRGRVNFDDFSVVLGGIKDNIRFIRPARRIMFLACGTSFHAGMAGRYFFEKTTNIPTICDLASDFLDRRPPLFRDDVCVFISQSGETADTLRCLEYCRQNECLCIGITNTVGSSIARSTHCGIHVNAGPEIGVASTKAYTSQVLCVLMLALVLNADTKSMEPEREEVIRSLQQLPEHIRMMLDKNDEVLQIAKEFQDASNMLLIARGEQYATCLEGALKIKEISYIHCEGVMAGELKHGPLALIDSEMPVFIVATASDHFDKVKMAIEEVNARGGQPIILCNEGETEFNKFRHVITVPTTHHSVQMLVNIIPIQLFSYHLACLRGLNVDCPRNLAKSVTVE